ncbi:MAG: hypothetical protein ACI8RZ_004895 [Myxococcota bacterium]|jgi:hypothetical protein
MHDETGVHRADLEDYLVGALMPSEILVVEEALFASPSLRRRLVSLAVGSLEWQVGDCRLAVMVRPAPVSIPPVRRLGLAAGSNQIMLEIDVVGLAGWTVRMLVAENADGEWDHDLELLGPPGVELPLAIAVTYSAHPEAGPRTLVLDPTVGAWFAEPHPPSEHAVLGAAVQP